MQRGPRNIATSDRIPITVNDCAFLRAVVKGMAVKDAGRRFIADFSDLRELRTRLGMLLKALENHIEISRASDAAQKLEALKLLRKALRRKPVTPKAKAADKAGQPLPEIPITFDAYNDRENPGGIYFRANAILSMYEKDVLAPWREACAKLGASTRSVANAANDTPKPAITESQVRLLVDSVRGLELGAAVEPGLDDALSLWVHNEALLRRLNKRNIKTVGDLYEHISKSGARWYEGLNGIGEKKARQVATWLSKAAPSLNIEVPAAALVPKSERRALKVLNGRERSLGIVPLEYMLVDYDSRGHNGALRGEGQRGVAFDDDYSAIEAYLAGFKGTTRRAYRIEIERFYLWCLYQRGIPLSSVMVEDCETYRSFLLDPQPRDRWIQPKRVQRTSPDWRPFMRALSPDAAERSLSILGSFFQWLLKSRYLTLNPFAVVREAPGADSLAEKQSRKISLRQKQRDQRVMQIDVWSLVDGYLLSLDTSDAGNARKVALMRLMQGTGLRAEEALLAQVGDLELKLNRDTGEQYYKLFVRGKGDKLRSVVVPNDAISALDLHFAHRGIGSVAEGIPDDGHEHAYLIGRIKVSKDSTIDVRRKGISYHVLYLTVDDVFQQTLAAAQKTPNLSREAKRKLTKASPHWLRHCFASLSLNHGLSVHTLAKLLGHRDEATTAIYAKDEDAELERQQLEAFAKARDRIDSLYRARGQ